MPMQDHFLISLHGGIYGTSTTDPPVEHWTTTYAIRATSVPFSQGSYNTLAGHVLVNWSTVFNSSRFPTGIDFTTAKVALIGANGHYANLPGIAVQANRAKAGTGTIGPTAQACFVVSLRGANTLDKHARGRMFLPCPAQGQVDSLTGLLAGSAAGVATLVKTAVTADLAAGVTDGVWTSPAAMTIAGTTGNIDVVKIEVALKPGIQRRRERSVVNTYGTPATMP